MRRRLYWLWLAGFLVVAGVIMGFEPVLARMIQAGLVLPGALLFYTYGVRVLVVVFGALLAWPLRWAGTGAAAGGAGPGSGGAWVRGGRGGRAGIRAALALSLFIALVVGLAPLGLIFSLLGLTVVELPSLVALALGSPTVSALALVWLGALLVALSSGRV